MDINNILIGTYKQFVDAIITRIGCNWSNLRRVDGYVAKYMTTEAYVEQSVESTIRQISIIIFHNDKLQVFERNK